MFGLLPHFATELAFGRRTYNARAETVATLPSFRHAWAAGQRCIVPAECILEPDWSTGRAVRRAMIEQAGRCRWPSPASTALRAPDGRERLTFAMITFNADGHPAMQRFPRPGEEKRMGAAGRGGLRRLARRPARGGAALLRPWPRALDAYPAPLPPRAPRPGSFAHAAPAVGAHGSPGGLFD